MAASPTMRSLAYLREQGYRVAVVEKWNQFAGIRQDLFGIIDLLAIRGAETLGVQVTSAAHVAERVTKIAESEAIADIRKAGWTVKVHGWRKASNGRWTLREVDLS